MHDVNMVRAECTWVLTNALSKATPDLVKAIVDLGYFTAINYALELTDPRILHVALEGICFALKKGMELPLMNGENPFVLMVEQCGLLDKIDDFQNIENEQVYDKAKEILETFFNDDDGDDDYVDPGDYEDRDSLPLQGQANQQQDGGISYNDLF